MPRAVTDYFKESAFAEETDEAWLILVTIDHAALDVPIRVSSDGVDTPSRGDLFVALPFDIRLPDDGGDSPPRARLSVDNVDREIVAAVRQAQGAPPSVLIEIVRGSAPDEVETTFPDFELKDAVYDKLVVEGELGVESMIEEPFPWLRFTPSKFPGLY